MLNYVKIPKDIIYDKSLKDKRVILFSYLCVRRSLDDTVAFSITELCHWSKLKPNYHDGKINKKYYELLLQLSQRGYFFEHPDFAEKLKEQTNSLKYQRVQLNTEKFDSADKFGIIYYSEVLKILNYKEELEHTNIELARMSSAYIFLVLSYLRVNMNYSVYKPYCCYRLYKTISDDIGLSERYISRVIDILDALRIVKTRPMKRELYIDRHGKEKFATTVKVFADYCHYIQNEKGEYVLDQKYNADKEIKKQISLLLSEEKEKEKLQKNRNRKE